MNLRITKLSCYENIQSLVRRADGYDASTILSHTEVVQVFIAWQLDVGKLKEVITFPKNTLWDKLRKRPETPNYLSNEKDIEEARQSLGVFAAKGDNSIFSSSSLEEEIREFFETFHYSEKAQEQMLISQARIDEYIFKDQLVQTAKEILTNGPLCLVCFGHDSDPIYIISDSQS